MESRSVDELLASKDIDVILNLTTPGAHAVIAMKALTAGKHVFGEKPLALTVEEAKPMMELAKSSGLRIGSAPDTVLGTGIQTSRDLLDSEKLESHLQQVHFGLRQVTNFGTQRHNFIICQVLDLYLIWVRIT